MNKEKKCNTVKEGGIIYCPACGSNEWISDLVEFFCLECGERFTPKEESR